MDRLGQIDGPGFLAGKDQPELIEKIGAVGFYRGGFHGYDDGVIAWTGQGFGAVGKSLLSNWCEVVIGHQPVIVACLLVEDEQTVSPHRLPFRKLAQPYLMVIQAMAFGMKFYSEVGQLLFCAVFVRSECYIATRAEGMLSHNDGDHSQLHLGSANRRQQGQGLLGHYHTGWDDDDDGRRG